MNNTITFLKKISLLALFLLPTVVFSQEILQPTDEKTYTEYMDKVLETVKINDANQFKNGILYDRVFSMARLDLFNNTDSTNTSGYDHFKRSWSELYSASLSPDFLTLQIIDDIAYHFERENIIQVGIINIDFTQIDSTALKPTNPKLEIVNQKIERIENMDPYIHKQVVVVSPLSSSVIYGNTVTFEFGKIFLNKSEKQIESLTAFFENDQSFPIIENGLFVNGSINVNFQENGLKQIAFDIEYSDGTFLTTFAVCPVQTIPPDYSEIQTIIANQSFQGYDEPSDCYGSCLGQGEYKVFLAPGNNEITKPYIVVDGFDPKDNRKIEGEKSIFEMMNYNNAENNFVETLNSEGFDVIILSFPRYVIGQKFIPIIGYINIYRDGGADYIQRNAKVLEALIDHVNSVLTSNGSTEKLIVAGPSMGALITQYALVEMEQNGENHNVDLWISFDGPHKGANISYGMQRAVKYLNLNSALYALKVPAAKQMLINHYLAYSEGFPQGAPGFRSNFQNELDNMGIPQQTRRNIAVLNGSITGVEKATPGANMAYLHASALLGLGNGKLWINNTPIYGQEEVFKLKITILWGTITVLNVNSKSTTSSSYGSLDNAPGGYFNIVQRAEEALDATFPVWYSHGITGDWGIYGEIPWWAHILAIPLVDWVYVDLKSDFSFVPTKSAIAYSGTSTLWRENIGCRNLVCTGETPFDSYFAPIENQAHASLHANGIEWLLDEIQGIEREPEYGGCSSVSAEIIGDNIICYNDTKTYQLDNTCSGSATWLVSSNLQVISSTNSSVYLKSISTNTGYAWVKATFDNGQSIIKHLVGKPLYNFEIEEDYPIILRITDDDLPIPLVEQNITSIEWVQTSPINEGELYAEPNSYDADVVGEVQGYVKVYNSCGYTQTNFDVDTNGNNCNSTEYYIESLGDNKYKLIDLCNPEEIQYVDESELYNIYGIKIQDLVPQQDEVDIDNTSNSGTIRIITVVKDGQIVTKRVIVD